MSRVLEFPNAVLWVTGYLRGALAANGYPGVRVADTYRGDDVEVWVQRDGGPVLDVAREAPRIRINVFHKAATSQPVDDLAQRVSTLMRAASGQGPVRDVEQLTGPTSVADTLPRRYMLFELTVTGEPFTLA